MMRQGSVAAPFGERERYELCPKRRLGLTGGWRRDAIKARTGKQSSGEERGSVVENQSFQRRSCDATGDCGGVSRMVLRWLPCDASLHSFGWQPRAIGAGSWSYPHKRPHLVTPLLCLLRVKHCAPSRCASDLLYEPRSPGAGDIIPDRSRWPWIIWLKRE